VVQIYVKADLRGANLRGAILTGANLWQLICGDDHDLCRIGWRQRITGKYRRVPEGENLI
jgi:uncharacterized protein YjbI with pentapeptide repeats